MKKSAHTIEIFLKQGEVYFGDRDTRIRTVLGSCVAITMWHPDLLIGGMCHYMLPSRHPRGKKFHCRIRDSAIGFPSRRATDKKELDGKYADEALELMFTEIQRSGTHADIEVVSQLLAHNGLKVRAEHLGGVGHRNLIFDISNGHVWMRHQTPAHSPCDNCEVREICPPT
jgi:chemotaxis protein CheD